MTIYILFAVVVFPSTVFASDISAPRRVDPREIESEIGAAAYFVVDQATGEALTMKQEDRVWPIASLTKLMTASIVLDSQVSLNRFVSMKNSDNVGGARLWVNEGDAFSVNDLFYATLVASANNAANALSRTTGLSKTDFVAQMNKRAKEFGLSRTHFVDPTGIDAANVSTPREMAELARESLSRKEIQKYTTTSTRFIRVASTGAPKKMINTNWMVWKSKYDDVWVTSGKTGYLNESGWNLAVTLKPTKNDKRELLIVVFGAKSRVSSFDAAQRLADWAWNVYRWNTSLSS
jgi:D-alanyl-D-alanine endopeptidase (penicillin-binding protein 7)